ncbi:MAG: RNHCP domain-containing protein [Patescibacteria group bacterium]
MAINFKRKIEDFVCDNCGQKVKGNGYTNHCPKCLWSKHVDTTPGDRASECEGMMEPLKTEMKRGDCDIAHKCVNCGYEKRNKMSPEDNFDEVLKMTNS